jgi:hypothetical protein
VGRSHAVVQSCSRAVLQFCGFAVLQSCSLALEGSHFLINSYFPPKKFVILKRSVIFADQIIWWFGDYLGAWRSWLAYLHGVQGVGSSSLLAPTRSEKGFIDWNPFLFWGGLHKSIHKSINSFFQSLYNNNEIEGSNPSSNLYPHICAFFHKLHGTGNLSQDIFHLKILYFLQSNWNYKEMHIYVQFRSFQLVLKDPDESN